MIHEPTVGEIASRDPIFCAPDTSFQEICRSLSMNSISCILVMDGGEAVGIISETDVVRVASSREDPDDIVASAIMSSPIIFVDEDTRITEASEMEKGCGVRRLVVRSRTGDLLGIVTEPDLVAASLDYVRSHSQQLEQEVEERTHTLKELSDAKDEFMGIAAHDLRSPLTVIRAHSDLLRYLCGDQVSPEILESIKAIGEQVDRMLILINDLLDVQKIASGTLRANMCVQEVGEIISSVFAANSFPARKKGIEMILEIPECVGYVWGDRNLLCSVLDNLINNAIKYSRNGDRVVVKVSAKGKKLQVDIIDTGMGIPEKEMGGLFSEFSRGVSVPTSGEYSTGLGLAIVKKALAHHDGNVWVTSEVDKGSTFSFDLPIHETAG